MLGSSSEGASMVGLGIRLIFSLALVLGLLLLIARVAGRRFKGRAGAAIQVVHRQQLTRSSSVAVVTVGTRVLVLGSTDQQVTLLTEVEPDEVGLDPETMQPEVDESGPQAAVPTALGPMAGSLLSANTWRQTLAQLRPRTPAGSRPEPEDRAS